MKKIELITKEIRQQLNDELTGYRSMKESNDGRLGRLNLLAVTMIQTMLKLADLEEAVVEIQKTISEKDHADTL